MNDYTELERYKLDQAKRALLDAHVLLNDQVRNVLIQTGNKTDGLDRALDSLADYALFFERCYCQ